jgi:hypothetical protein
MERLTLKLLLARRQLRKCGCQACAEFVRQQSLDMDYDQ